MLRTLITIRGPFRKFTAAKPLGSLGLATSSTAKKHLFLVYAPDNVGDGTFEKRLEVREQHLQEALLALEPEADVSMSMWIRPPHSHRDSAES